MNSIMIPTEEHEELKLNKADKKGSVRANGFIGLTYNDDIDNTLQFCRTYLLLDYNP